MTPANSAPSATGRKWSLITGEKCPVRRAAANAPCPLSARQCTFPSMSLLEVRDLRASFTTPAGEARAVDGVSFDLAAGEMVGLVGESGCGKSVLASSLLRLVPPPGRITGGSIAFDGRDLLSLDARAMRDLRGRRIAMIVQEPSAALDPLQSIGGHVAEVARVHGERSRKVAERKALAMLERVGLQAEYVARSYPHQLSGGMRQRVLIAMALLLEPVLVIADEPTTALDETVQEEILDLLGRLQRETGTAVLFITHDLAVVERTCSRALVMYAGQVVEQAPVGRLFGTPSHPYTRGLLASLPRLGQGRGRFETIPGTVPSPLAWPAACRFRERCTVAIERCATEAPALTPVATGGTARCLLVPAASE
ncbi:MAG: ABC transporter ATP-binding protein [Proteobacteria bacterium]|nr:ABC transporter ATP-binding protein [Pseudomonadota bacterium]